MLFKGISLRCVMIDGQPWFVGADALKALGYSTVSAANHYKKLPEETKSYVKRINVGMAPGRDVTVLSEEGLYKLALRSDKAEAKAFQDWVTRDVLPDPTTITGPATSQASSCQLQLLAPAGQSAPSHDPPPDPDVS